MTTINMKEIEQKAYRYSRQDGFVEILTGFFFVFYGGVCYDLFTDFETEFPYIPLVLFFVFSGAALEFIRRRTTYPRIGRAKIIEEIRPRYFVTFIVPFAFYPMVLYSALRFFGDVYNIDLLVKWSPAFLGIILVGMFHDLVKKTGNTSYYGIAGLSVVSGFILSLMHFSPTSTGILIFFLIMGALLSLFGLITFVQFLRHNPVVTEEDTHE
jgi:hypothetical protein